MATWMGDSTTTPRSIKQADHLFSLVGTLLHKSISLVSSLFGRDSTHLYLRPAHRVRLVLQAQCSPQADGLRVLYCFRGRRTPEWTGAGSKISFPRTRTGEGGGVTCLLLHRSKMADITE